MEQGGGATGEHRFAQMNGNLQMAEFTLPNLGEDVDEADVLRVLVREGDTIAIDDPLLEIETEKATLDVPSSVAGVVTALHVSAGDTIRPGQLILTVSAAAETAGALDGPPARPREAPPAPAAEPTAGDPTASALPGTAPAGDRGQGELQEAVTPTLPVATAPVPGPPPVEDGTAIFASPAVRKFAREIGVPLAEVRGGGPGGRISEDDVKAVARRSAIERASQPRAAEGAVSRAPLAEPRALPDFTQFGAVRREPMSRLRRTVARNMTQSWTTIPHVTLDCSADVTEMETLRQRFKETAQKAGGNLTISVFILKILAGALKAHPLLASSVDMEAQEIVHKDFVNIGVAVDTDRGLVVPVIRDVDQKNIIELSVELNEVAERARSNALTLEDSRGGTFTLTNLGSLGIGHFAPVINPPEVAVLGVGRAQWQPVLDRQRRWEPRLIMPMSLSHDHRVIDGADGARFLQWIVDAIDNPMLLALEG